MNVVGIFYFSGTGNTEIVADIIKNEFEKWDYIVDLIKIEDVLKGVRKIEMHKYHLVGIGCQVIGYYTPNLVYKFMRRLPVVKDKKVFVFRTAGGVGPINYNASNPIIRKLSGKGYEVFHERIFSIGSNWIVKFDTSIMKQLHQATLRKIGIMCEDVIAGKTRLLKTELKLKLGIGLIGPVSIRLLRLVGKDLRVSKACSDCGLCIKKCPAGNVKRKNGSIKFGWSCNCCLRCVYSCPKKAINFRFLKFIPVEGGYNVRNILSEPCGDYEKVEKIPPFFNEYIRNDEL